MANIAKNRLKSTWTPLNNEEANRKIFEERRTLVNKWFEKWSNAQRKTVLSDLVSKCKLRQLEFTGDIISQKRPVRRDDFTRLMPRVITLYIFSFLDPRSLCRASQVCWYWKFLTELDQIWMPKAMQLGWILPFSPSPYENGVWKRLYIENINALKCFTPKVSDISNELGKLGMKDRMSLMKRSTPRPSSAVKMDRPPWKGSDPTPKDTWRNNYLDNDDEIEKVNKLRKRHIYGAEAEDIVRRAHGKVKTGMNHEVRSGISRVQKSRSMTKLSRSSVGPTERPTWAKHSPGSPFVNMSAVGDPKASLDASVRPSPVKPARLTTSRTPRDLPTTKLFPDNPWDVPAEEEISMTKYFPDKPWNVPTGDIDSDE